MKSKRKYKIGLSLLIAMCFIFPTTLAISDRGGYDAGEEPITYKNSDSSTRFDRETYQGGIQNPLAIQAQVSITGINLLPAMPVDCYDINITLEHTDVPPYSGRDCEIKAIMDIFERIPKECEEIICFDFEDTWDIYNYWDSVDDTTDSTSGPGGIDTWCRTDVRSHSPSYSMRSTQFDDHYMGNQLDYLMVHLDNMSAFEEIEVDFWHICFGEVIDDGDGNDILEDYGWCEYSFDGVTWLNTFDDMSAEEQYFYDNETWDNINLTIPNPMFYDDVYFRFAWTTGPTCQNEGWFVDDVCFCGREEADIGELVFTSHSLEEFIVPSTGPFVWEFPETWCPEEGEYLIRIWLLSETRQCEVLNPQDNPFEFIVEIGDVVDLNMTYNCIISPSTQPFLMGDDLIVEGTVCNDGTVDAFDVPITFQIKEQITDIAFTELFESGPYEVYINAIGSEMDSWNSKYFTSGGDYDEWHVSDYASVSPTHAMTCYNETFDGMVADMDTSICSPRIDYTTDDPLSIDFVCDLMYEVGPGTSDYHGIFPYLGGDTIGNFIFGTDDWEPWAGGITGSSGGWIQWSMSDWITSNTIYWEVNTRPWGGYGELENGLVDWLDIRRDDHPEYDWSNLGFGFVINTFDYPSGVTSASLGVPAAGVFFDNVQIIKTYSGGVRFTEVLIIDEIKAATPTEPAECVDFEFEWPDMPTGDFVEEKCVPNDDNNDNNCKNDDFEVVYEIAYIDEEDVETQDLTESEDCNWHVTSSGYNNYLWAGIPCDDEEGGTYGDDWNCALTFAPDGDPVMDWQGLSQVCLIMDEYAEVLANDYAIIEINPYVDSDSPDSQWYQYDPQLTTLIHFEDFEAVPAGTFVDYGGTGGWIPFPYGPNPGPFPPGSPISPWWDWVAGDFPPPPPNAIWACLVGGLYLGWTDPPYPEAGFIMGPFDLTGIPMVMVNLEGTFEDWGGYGSGGDFAIDVYSDGFVWPDNEEQYLSIFDYHPPALDGFIYASSDLQYYGYDPFGQNHVPISGIGSFDPSEVYLEFYGLGPQVNLGMDNIELWASEPLNPGAAGSHGWTNVLRNLRPDNFIHPYSGDTFLTDIGPTFTDEMGLRIRFISDSDYHLRGVLLDNIEITDCATDVLFDLDECDTLDNFMVGTPLSGDFWYFIDNVAPTPDVWCCEDLTIPGLPHDLNNALVWETSVPQAMSAALHFYHDYDLLPGDYCYIEFSNDGGSAWTAPVRYSGIGAGYAEIDMTPFVGDNVLIRWRIDTNETEVSDHYCVQEMRITAKIDENPPVTTGTLSGTVIHGWYSTPVTFTATATDDVSGVDATYYKIDGGSTLTYSAPITISVNGEHYIEYWSVDKVGNEEIHHITPTFKIDTGSAPSVSITAPGDGLYLFGNQILSLSGRIIIIGGFTVQASASDADSGVFRV
jgi:hypothetical protein